MSIAEKLTQIAENERSISNGINTEADLIAEIKSMVDNLPEATGGGYEEGYEAGRQAEYDQFWDAYQKNGARKHYSNAFDGQGEWTDEIFKPKYDIVLGLGYTGQNVFAYCEVTNVAESLEKQGVRLDTTLCGCLNSIFQSSTTKRVPELNCTHIMDYQKDLNNAFSNSSVVTIDKLIVPDGMGFTNTFYNSTALENITFEGVISKNISFAQSPKLTNDSVQSIIDHLKDLTGSTAQTLTLHADVGAKLTQTQKDAISAKNWNVTY